MQMNSIIRHGLPKIQWKSCLWKHCKRISYVQGQSPETNTREYFYYIDHQGMLFLDDARMKNFTSCFKEKKFLHFFFTRLQLNKTKKYNEDFPYISPCGREKNYIRCDDLPIVFTHVLEVKDSRENITDYLSYGYAGDMLKVKFEPQKICMFPQSGRVYHPAIEKVGGVGLVKSSLAIEFSKYFEFNSDQDPNSMPTHFWWKGEKYGLTNELLSTVGKYSKCYMDDV